ncbi:MAG TPA: glycosyltransferase [Sphingomicrobium sp.]
MLMGKRPIVSVLLTAHDRERFIGDAVRSVLHQSFADFELVIVDDGSTDRTVDVIRAFDDPRIRLVRHAANQGIPAARNRALDEANGTFIAWLDSDDVSRPNRLTDQLAFLAAHPEVAMVGACAGKIDAHGRRKSGIRIPPFAHDDIRAWQLFQSPFQQSSLMGRAEILKRHPYRAQYPVCEDVDLFLRLTRKHCVANIPKVLIDRRLHEQQTVEIQQQRIRRMKAELARPLLTAIGVNFSSPDLERHVDLGLINAIPQMPHGLYLDWAEDWLARLLAANARTRLLDRDALDFAAGQVWLRTCRGAARAMGARAAVRFLGSRLSLKAVRTDGRKWLREALPLFVAGR